MGASLGRGSVNRLLEPSPPDGPAAPPPLCLPQLQPGGPTDSHLLEVRVGKRERDVCVVLRGRGRERGRPPLVSSQLAWAQPQREAEGLQGRELWWPLLLLLLSLEGSEGPVIVAFEGHIPFLLHPHIWKVDVLQNTHGHPHRRMDAQGCTHAGTQAHHPILDMQRPLLHHEDPSTPTQ